MNKTIAFIVLSILLTFLCAIVFLSFNIHPNLGINISNTDSQSNNSFLKCNNPIENEPVIKPIPEQCPPEPESEPESEPEPQSKNEPCPNLDDYIHKIHIILLKNLKHVQKSLAKIRNVQNVPHLEIQVNYQLIYHQCITLIQNLMLILINGYQL